jgi:hypothetical protein
MQPIIVDSKTEMKAPRADPRKSPIREYWGPIWAANTAPMLPKATTRVQTIA